MPSAGAHAQRQQPSFARAGQLARRLLHPLSQRVEALLAGDMLYHGGRRPRPDADRFANAQQLYDTDSSDGGMSS